jgi:HEAT repeat protein
VDKLPDEEYAAYAAALIENFSKDDPALLEDAANKLGRMGRHSLPALTKLLNESSDEKLRRCAVLALSRNKDKGAAAALLPLLKDPKTKTELRLLAVDGASASGLEQTIPALQEVAGNEKEDEELRFRALQALCLMPEAWAGSEKLFVAALEAPQDRIRRVAAQACLQAAFRKPYRSAEPKLIQMALKESVEETRGRAIMALGRMKSAAAAPAFAELVLDAQTPPAVSAAARGALGQISGLSFKDSAAVQAWWEKTGKARYAKPAAPKE